MTNEELKEGRRLLDRLINTLGPPFHETETQDWLWRNREALLSAAEQLTESTPNSVVGRIAIQRNLALAALGLKPNAGVEEIRAKDAEIAELRKKYDGIGAEWQRLLKLVDEDEWKRLTDQLEAAMKVCEKVRALEADQNSAPKEDAMYVALAELDRVRGKT